MVNIRPGGEILPVNIHRGETFFGGDPIMAHRLQCCWHRGGKIQVC